MVRLLITGFEPFGGERINPSHVAVERLAAQDWSDIEVSTLVLPVVRYRCIEMTVEAIESRRPDLVVMLGEAGARMHITPERVAINVDDFRQPDNAANQPVDEPVMPGGPAAFFSTLPIKAMVERLHDIGVPAAVSNTAGTYLCNHVSYGVLHHIAARGLPVRAGFIHLPYLPEQAATKAVATPSMGEDTLVRGLRAALLVAAGAALPEPAHA